MPAAQGQASFSFRQIPQPKTAMHTSRASTFCTLAPNIFGIIIPVMFSLHTKLCYQFTCTEHEAPDNNEVQRSLQNCGSSVWILRHVTFLAPRIWIIWPIWVKFSTEDLHAIALSFCEFRKNGLSKSCTLLKTVNDILPVFYICFIRFGHRPGQALRAPVVWGSQNL